MLRSCTAFWLLDHPSGRKPISLSGHRAGMETGLSDCRKVSSRDPQAVSAQCRCSIQANASNTGALGMLQCCPSIAAGDVLSTHPLSNPGILVYLIILYGADVAAVSTGSI